MAMAPRAVRRPLHRERRRGRSRLILTTTFLWVNPRPDLKVIVGDRIELANRFIVSPGDSCADSNVRFCGLDGEVPGVAAGGSTRV
ncbi:hypothetical protein DFQ27_009980 [Actinomortierella ambigua]|uniref:Uncharacterized protein n=1 Tax=Actinomortierella ambigua TaxID=1343610 RepID=A0A9P6TWP6_9FUNG|nr:hypothetical protein DFQ27_009980 [Actinomortierella ambigua]